MQVNIYKISKLDLNSKSYQMRIEFKEKFTDSDYEEQFIIDLDLEWKKIEVHYCWHIGENFVDGFFDDFDNLKIKIDDIISSAKKALIKYKEKIVVINFTEIN